MTTLIRFERSGTNTDFYDTGIESEILKVRRYPREQRIDISTDWFGRTFLYPVGCSYERFSIDFNLIKIGGIYTIDKLKNLYDYVDDYLNPLPTKIYWKYHEDTSVYITCQMRREMYQEIYTYGEQEAITITIDFIETIGFISVPAVDMYNMPGIPA